MSHGYVAIECEGIVQVHAIAPEGLPYATLCGLDGDDPPDQRAAPLLIGARIDCPHCFGLIMTAKKYRQRDFVAKLKLA